MEKLEQFIELLSEIIGCVETESARIHAGQPSEWDINQLDNVVRPETSELLSFALKGEVFFKYGKNQRMLESTYVITDSPSELSKTSLGKKIYELQDLYYSI